MPDRNRRGRDSVSTRVAAEHRRLDALFGEFRRALETPGQGVSERFADLREALESHFAQEGDLYYPAIWSLRPDRKLLLEGFIRAHGVFRRDLDQVGGHLDADERAAAGAAFEAFTSAFAQHEVAEEQLLSSLDQELDLHA